jgi:hypothetical protein
MNYNFNPEQTNIYNKVKAVLREETDAWLSLPHKSFRDRPPIEMLLAKNYDYFYTFLSNEV